MLAGVTVKLVADAEFPNEVPPEETVYQFMVLPAVTVAFTVELDPAQIGFVPSTAVVGVAGSGVTETVTTAQAVSVLQGA